MALTPVMNDDQLDVFRSKVCQRLSRDGMCQWKSKCQFSHCIEWPRRPSRKHRYSPDICPNLRVVSLENDGGFSVTNKCDAGRSCRYAHSSEEVLYHPLIYKTTFCEEYNKQGRSNRASTNGKKRCQQYYCPFAHGEDELRTSSVSPEQIKMYLSSLQAFTSGADVFKDVSLCKDFSSSNPQEGSAYANLKQDSLMFSQILSTAPGLQASWTENWASNHQLGSSNKQNNASDNILAIKSRSPPVLAPPQCDQFPEYTPKEPRDLWSLNLPLPMKIETDCNSSKGTAKEALINDDDDDGEQLFRDLSAYMYAML